MREIPLTQGKVALIDDADYELVNQYRWFATKRNNVWYAIHQQRRGSEKRIVIDMHRLIMGFPPSTVDHRDGDGLNNTRANLRNATIKQNVRNSRKRSDNTSGYKGVSWDKEKQKWRAYIGTGIAGQTKHIGRFSTPEEAARAYDAAAIELFGEFAHLNFSHPA